MSKGRVTGILGAVAAIAALLLAWSFFAPTQLGGGTSYAIVVGNSMEPGLHRGDLTVVRARSSYRPGDVVLYDSRDLGTKVLHRIVREENGRYVLKGDNNSFLDVERPTQDQILGTLWVRAPAVGRATVWLRQPLHSALLVGLITLIALGGGLGAGAAVRRGSQSPAVRAAATSAVPRTSPDGPGTVVAILAAALVGCIALALVSFGRPLTRAETVEAAYAHQGRFEYEARVPRSPVYPDGRVGTGEPVFLRLVPRLKVSFAYELESQQAVDARGTIALDARLSDGRGWERVLPLTTETRFTDGDATASGVLDLAWIERILEDVRDLTGSAQAIYTVAVLPRVQVEGTVGSQPVDATFSPALAFDLGDLRLQPSFDGGEGIGPLAPRESGSGTRTSDAEVSLGPVSLSVATARRVSLLGVAALLLVGGVALGVRRRRPGGDESEWIEARHGHLIVPVSRPPDHWANVADVADFDALVRLADRYGRLILHLVGDGSYVVEDGRNAYRYRTRPPEPVTMVWPPAASDTRVAR